MDETGTEKKEENVTVVAGDKPAVPQIQMGYPLLQHTDMKEDMRTEALEACVVACEKFPENLEHACQTIVEEMGQKYCGNWHAVIGEAFGFEVTHELKKVLYTYFGGNLAVLVWSM